MNRYSSNRALPSSTTTTTTNNGTTTTTTTISTQTTTLLPRKNYPNMLSLQPSIQYNTHQLAYNHGYQREDSSDNDDNSDDDVIVNPHVIQQQQQQQQQPAEKPKKRYKVKVIVFEPCPTLDLRDRTPLQSTQYGAIIGGKQLFQHLKPLKDYGFSTDSIEQIITPKVAFTSRPIYWCTVCQTVVPSHYHSHIYQHSNYIYRSKKQIDKQYSCEKCALTFTGTNAPRLYNDHISSTTCCENPKYVGSLQSLLQQLHSKFPQSLLKQSIDIDTSSDEGEVNDDINIDKYLTYNTHNTQGSISTIKTQPTTRLDYLPFGIQHSPSVLTAPPPLNDGKLHQKLLNLFKEYTTQDEFNDALQAALKDHQHPLHTKLAKVQLLSKHLCHSHCFKTQVNTILLPFPYDFTHQVINNMSYEIYGPPTDEYTFIESVNKIIMKQQQFYRFHITDIAQYCPSWIKRRGGKNPLVHTAQHFRYLSVDTTCFDTLFKTIPPSSLLHRSFHTIPGIFTKLVFTAAGSLARLNYHVGKTYNGKIDDNGICCLLHDLHLGTTCTHTDTRIASLPIHIHRTLCKKADLIHPPIGPEIDFDDNDDEQQQQQQQDDDSIHNIQGITRSSSNQSIFPPPLRTDLIYPQLNLNNPNNVVEITTDTIDQYTHMISKLDPKLRAAIDKSPHEHSKQWRRWCFICHAAISPFTDHTDQHFNYLHSLTVSTTSTGELIVVPPPRSCTTCCLKFDKLSAYQAHINSPFCSTSSTYMGTLTDIIGYELSPFVFVSLDMNSNIINEQNIINDSNQITNGQLQLPLPDCPTLDLNDFTPHPTYGEIVGGQKFYDHLIPLKLYGFTKQTIDKIITPHVSFSSSPSQWCVICQSPLSSSYNTHLYQHSNYFHKGNKVHGKKQSCTACFLTFSTQHYNEHITLATCRNNPNYIGPIEKVLEKLHQLDPKTKDIPLPTVTLKRPLTLSRTNSNLLSSSTIISPNTSLSLPSSSNTSIDTTIIPTTPLLKIGKITNTRSAKNNILGINNKRKVLVDSDSDVPFDDNKSMKGHNKMMYYNGSDSDSDYIPTAKVKYELIHEMNEASRRLSGRALQLYRNNSNNNDYDGDNINNDDDVITSTTMLGINDDEDNNNNIASLPQQNQLVHNKYRQQQQHHRPQKRISVQQKISASSAKTSRPKITKSKAQLKREKLAAKEGIGIDNDENNTNNDDENMIATKPTKTTKQRAKSKRQLKLESYIDINDDEDLTINNNGRVIDNKNNNGQQMIKMQRYNHGNNSNNTINNNTNNINNLNYFSYLQQPIVSLSNRDIFTLPPLPYYSQSKQRDDEIHQSFLQLCDVIRENVTITLQNEGILPLPSALPSPSLLQQDEELLSISTPTITTTETPITMSEQEQDLSSSSTTITTTIPEQQQQESIMSHQQQEEQSTMNDFISSQ